VTHLLSLGGHRWLLPPRRQEVDFPVAQGLAERLGGEHHIIGRSESDGTDTAHDGAVTVHTLSARLPLALFAPAAARVARRIIRDLGPDVVMTTSDAAGALSYLTRPRRSWPPTVVQVQGGLLDAGPEYGSRAKRTIIDRTMRRAVRRGDAVRALNARIAEQVRAAGCRNPVAIIGSRVDVARFQPPPQATPSDPPRIGAVGGMAEVKNHEVLIDAIAQLGAAGIKAELVLVGDGPRRAALAERARARHVADRVVFTGALPYSEVPEVLQSLSAFAQPSFSEGEPRALLEAQATGLATVVSDIPAHRGIVRSDVNGVIVPATDASAWADAFRVLIEHPDRASALGHAARASVCAEHEFETLLDRFAKLLRETASCASTA
jgi:glycosyltransferase involved in cell wall biosynthesis